MLRARRGSRRLFLLLAICLFKTALHQRTNHYFWWGHPVLARNDVDTAAGITFVDVSQCYDSLISLAQVKLWAALANDGADPHGCLRVILARPQELPCDGPMCRLASEGRFFAAIAQSQPLCVSNRGVQTFTVEPALEAQPGDCLGWQYDATSRFRIPFTKGGSGHVWWHRAILNPGDGGHFSAGEARTYSIIGHLNRTVFKRGEACMCTDDVEPFRLRMLSLLPLLNKEHISASSCGYYHCFHSYLDRALDAESCDTASIHQRSSGQKSINVCAVADLAKSIVCAIKAWRGGDMLVASSWMDQSLYSLLEHDFTCMEDSSWPVTTSLILSASMELIRRTSMQAERALASTFWHASAWLSDAANNCPHSMPDHFVLEQPVAIRRTARVACLVAFRMPEELPLVEAIAETWGPKCDVLAFFMARRGAITVLELRGGFRVINLADIYPSINDDFMLEGQHASTFGDPTRRSNCVEKSLHVLRWSASHLADRADIFCLFDADSYVIPENVRRFANDRHLHADAAPKYFGRLNDFAKRTLGLLMAFPDGGEGVCFTKSGLIELGRVLEVAPYRHDLEQNWDNIRHECAYISGHNDDLTLLFCTKLAGVEPVDAYDELGRLFGSNTPLPCREHWESEGLRKELDTILTPLPQSDARALAEKFTSAELTRYLKCRPEQFRNHWLHPHAYVFHGYKDAALLRAADDVVRNGATCEWFAPHWQLRVSSATK